jgi:predicted nuclease of predicted toxin-antitoxin system
MKVLCDVHISHKIVRFLKKNQIESVHVNDILDSWFTKDKDIAIYADAHDFIIFTKDADFRNSYFLTQTPKKLIKLGLGNISTNQLIAILTDNLENIRKICVHNTFIIEINSDQISYSMNE